MLGLNIDYVEAYTIIKPLALFILGMIIYSIFVFKFYHFLSKKNIIELNLVKYSTSEHWLIKSVFLTFLYGIEFIILMPVLIFFWFSVLVVLLSFLAKNQSIEIILLVAIAVVGTVRAVSYYNEDLSKDLAKMLPLALLGVFLVDISFFEIESSLNLIQQIPGELSLMAYYLAFIILLEFVLRFVFFILGAFFPTVEKNESEEN